MKVVASSVEDYLNNIADDKKEAVAQLRNTVKQNLPEGFVEQLSYGMIGFVVPKTLYPNGYHCTPELPLPFINIAAQKNFVALYHMGIYADEKLYNWFINEYPKHSKTKLDMGKSCIRFKKPEQIPYDLIATLSTKMTPQNWIELYETNFKR
ncbi:MAG: DUF1801 domain-containing protein [Chitinophagales bacterium]|nr:DUF1801 domain-containing protein [Chitinophagales bacterium]